MRLILDGETELAEQEAETLRQQSPENGTVARALYTTQIGMIRWMQGRRSSSETLLKAFPPLEEIARDRYWLSTVTVLAEIARIHGPRDHAMQLRELILPFADHLVPVGIGVSFWGTAARTLGLLEESLGMLDEARSHLELAIEMSSRIGALAWHAEAQIELAEFGIRNEISDIPSYTLLAEARATAEARGFTMLAHRSMPPPRIRVLGRFEVTSLCGKRAEWSSRRARELLKMATAKRLYRGPAFSDEPYADWAIEAREHAEHVRQLLD